MTDNLNNTQILKLFVDLKKEMATYKEETTKKISSLENEIVDLNKIIDKQNKELLAKDNEINVLKITIENMKKDHKETVSIMAKEIRELKKENKQLKRIIKDKDREINNLNKRIDNLEKENQKLNNQKTKNSSNSSKPPSTDGFNKIVHSMRNKSDKNVGGQKLHQGTTLKKIKLKK